MIQRYSINVTPYNIEGWQLGEVKRVLHDYVDVELKPDNIGDYVLWDDVAPLLTELKGLRRHVEYIDEALNSGDGSYRP